MMTATGKAYKGVGMEGPIARWYAVNTGKDMGRHERTAEEVAERAPRGADVLEVAPGPGYLSIALARTGDYTVTGLDISETFVEIARKNAAADGVAVEFRHGNASAMPFDDESFDFIVCCAAFKNFADPVGAIQEMYRVLRPGGEALINDLRRDVSKQAVEEEVAGMKLGPVSRVLTRYTLGTWLPKRAYTAEEFTRMASRTGFGSAEIRETPLGLGVTLRK
jgi:ubiquinone/menaquinone biosynthesis C-methylase UbiE